MRSPEQIQNSHAVDIVEGDTRTRGPNRSILLAKLKKLGWFVFSVVVLCILRAYLVAVLVVVASLLTVALLIVRWVQLTKRGDGFDHVIQLKFLLRSWICLTGVCFIILVPLCWAPIDLIPGPPVVPSGLLYLIIAICFLSCALPAIVHRFLPVRIQLDHNESGINFPEAVSELVNCIISWLLVSKLLKLKGETLGIPDWRWIEKVILATIGYNCIRIVIYGILWLLKKACEALDPGTRTDPHWYLLVVDNLLARKHVVYFANGMKSSIIFILTSVMLLLIWVLYFGKQVDKSEQAARVSEIGTWTFVSLLICALLWLIKTCVLLAWEARVIYDRLESQIMEARKQLYFLGLLGRHRDDIFKLLYHDNPPKNLLWKFCRSFFEVATPDIKYRSKTDKRDCCGVSEVNQHAMKKLSTQKKKAVRDDLLMPTGHFSTIHDIKEITLYLQAAKDALSNKNYASDIRSCLMTNTNDHGVQVERLKQLIIGEENLNGVAQNSCNQPASDRNENNVEPLSKNTGNTVQPSSEGITEQSKNNVQSSIEANVEQTENNVLASSEEIVVEAQHDVQPLSQKPENNVQARSQGVVEQTENNVPPSSEPRIVGETENNDWYCFEKMLDINDDSNAASFEEMIPSEKLEMWLEMVQKNCLFLANAVHSGMELVDYLDAIINGVIIGATFILWLLLTKLASTKVLVVIASPVLAASFVFGDTCKNLFQSIIFVYVLHPFDVGDLCDIQEDHKMEVKSIGVWKTTFSKIGEAGNQVEVIYPNSELANKKVTNYKTKLNLHGALKRSAIETSAQSMGNNDSM